MINHEHKAIDGDLYFVAYTPNGDRHIGTCRQGLTMATGQPDLEWSYDADELLTLVEDKDIDFSDWREVPEMGEPVLRGLYSYNGKLVMCYQDHTRTEHAIEDIPALFGIHRGAGAEVQEWVQPVGGHDAYQIGDKVLFSGSTYQSVINANVWSPAVYPAGWEVV